MKVKGNLLKLLPQKYYLNNRMDYLFAEWPSFNKNGRLLSAIQNIATLPLVRSSDFFHLIVVANFQFPQKAFQFAKEHEIRVVTKEVPSLHMLEDAPAWS
jgi:hypothetical protein